MGLDPNRPIVATIGRHIAQKAPLDFVTAAKAVLVEEPNVQFLMVGDGPLEADVRAAIGDESRIQLTGFQDNVPEILSVLDVFALSSLWEGLGRALTEALIMACPVAVTDAGGMPELVQHRETGMLSAAGNPSALAENIVWLLRDRNEAIAMGQRGHDVVVPAFCSKQMVEQIEALYRRLLGTTAPRAADYELALPTPATPEPALALQEANAIHELSPQRVNV